MEDVNHSDRSYRRGAIMGLTMAEAFILIAFALLLLFAFWQWEKEQENTPAVEEFKTLPYAHKITVLGASRDGSLEAFLVLKEQGVDFSTPASMENPKDKWRFIDKNELRRLNDAAASLPEDMQRDLANMVENSSAAEILKQMGELENLVAQGEELADLLADSELVEEVKQSGYSISDLLGTARLAEILNETGVSTADLLQTADELDSLLSQGFSLDELRKMAQTQEALQQAGQSLEEISEKIKNSEAQEAALVAALNRELGEIVAEHGGMIDGKGSIIMPSNILFDLQSDRIKPELKNFLSEVCEPWLSVLMDSGIEISEVKIEGHASPEWGEQSLSQAYLNNLALSQDRSKNVLTDCLYSVANEKVHKWARDHLVAIGYSSVRPVFDSGALDNEASRRVVFSVQPNRDSLIDEIGSSASYDRSAFGGWLDLDSDCINTRHEMLSEYSQTVPKWSGDNCRVERGYWIDAYTGQDLYSASAIEIDHVVPLKWAWDHGADAWSDSYRSEFANDRSNLQIVERTTNAQKGSKGLEDWLPPSENRRCKYISLFSEIVVQYELLLSDEEREIHLRHSSEYCR